MYDLMAMIKGAITRQRKKPSDWRPSSSNTAAAQCSIRVLWRGGGRRHTGSSLSMRHRDNVYAIELERDRRETAKARLEGAHVMAPCSFFDARVNSGSIAVVWLNPPFDQNVKGGRAEVDFLIKATSLLTPGGILCFVVPGPCGREFLATGLSAPAGTLRPVGRAHVPGRAPALTEVVVIGTKRRSSVPVDDDLWDQVPQQPLADCRLKWQGPQNDVFPKLFAKGGLTEDELKEALSCLPALERHAASGSAEDGTAASPAGQGAHRPPAGQWSTGRDSLSTGGRTACG